MCMLPSANPNLLPPLTTTHSSTHIHTTKPLQTPSLASSVTSLKTIQPLPMTTTSTTAPLSTPAVTPLSPPPVPAPNVSSRPKPDRTKYDLDFQADLTMIDQIRPAGMKLGYETWSKFFCIASMDDMWECWGQPSERARTHYIQHKTEWLKLPWIEQKLMPFKLPPMPIESIELLPLNFTQTPIPASITTATSPTPITRPSASNSVSPSNPTMSSSLIHQPVMATMLCESVGEDEAGDEADEPVNEIQPLLLTSSSSSSSVGVSQLASLAIENHHRDQLLPPSRFAEIHSHIISDHPSIQPTMATIPACASTTTPPPPLPNVPSPPDRTSYPPDLQAYLAMIDQIQPAGMKLGFDTWMDFFCLASAEEKWECWGQPTEQARTHFIQHMVPWLKLSWIERKLMPFKLPPMPVETIELLPLNSTQIPTVSSTPTTTQPAIITPSQSDTSPASSKPPLPPRPVSPTADTDIDEGDEDDIHQPLLLTSSSSMTESQPYKRPGVVKAPSFN